MLEVPGEGSRLSMEAGLSPMKTGMPDTLFTPAALRRFSI